jgi:hypothetical protein
MSKIWRQFNELPKIGSKIFLLERHWKDVYPTSFRLEGWEVMEDFSPENKGGIYLDNGDDQGEGWQSKYWHQIVADECFLWWCYADDIKHIFSDLPKYANQPYVDLQNE